MIDAADRWLSDVWEDRRRIAGGALGLAIPTSLGQPIGIQILCGALAYLVVSMLDDLCGLVTSLHDCVHEAAKEAALDLLRASEQAQGPREHEHVR